MSDKRGYSLHRTERDEHVTLFWYNMESSARAFPERRAAKTADR
jgi:hypothetical protein